MEKFSVYLDSGDALSGSTTPYRTVFNLGSVYNFAPQAEKYANEPYCYVKVSNFSIKYTATQFALLTSFMALSRTQLSAPSGWLVEGIHWERFFSFLSVSNLDWVCFFILTALLSIPALLIVFRAAK